jgi:hypothetical protein
MRIPLRAGSKFGKPARLAIAFIPFFALGAGGCGDDTVRDLSYGSPVGAEYTLPDSGPVRDGGNDALEVADAMAASDATDASDATGGAGALDMTRAETGVDAPGSTAEVPGTAADTADAAGDLADDLASSG